MHVSAHTCVCVCACVCVCVCGYFHLRHEETEGQRDCTTFWSRDLNPGPPAPELLPPTAGIPAISAHPSFHHTKGAALLTPNDTLATPSDVEGGQSPLTPPERPPTWLGKRHFIRWHQADPIATSQCRTSRIRNTSGPRRLTWPLVGNNPGSIRTHP